MWREDEILSKYKDSWDKYNYISFDIFDTLLLRAVDKPQDIFLQLGSYAIKKGYTRKNLTPMEFKKIRLISEVKAFDNCKKQCENINLDNEITLIDIYNEMPKNLGDLDKIMDLEIEIEKQYTYLNPVTYELLKYLKNQGKKILLISNMYLNQNQIKEILVNNKFDCSLIDELVVSCEVSMNKSSGKLFEYVMEKYNIDCKEIVHIGDNFDCDIQGAKKAGIDFIKYDVSIKENTFIDIEKYKYGSVLPEIKSLRKIIGNLTANYNAEEKFWFKFGASVIGPLLTVFSQYTIDRAIEDDIEIIRPFMREGVVLEPLLKRAAKIKNYECDIKSLYISRAATFLPAMDKITADSLDSIFSIKNIKFEDAMKIIGLELEYVSEFKDYFYKYCNEIKKEEIKIIIDYILENHMEKLDNFKNENKHNLLQYLQQENIQSEKLITVDLGFAGSVQQSLEKIMNRENIYTNMLHLIALSSDKLYEKLQKGVNLECFTGTYEENIELNDIIIDKVMLLEELMMDERGSTLGYKNTGTCIKPVLDENRIPKEEFRYKELCREGIFKFQEMYYEYLYDEELTRNIYKRKSEFLNILTRFMSVPTYEESLNLSKLHHENNFGTSSIERICKDEDFEILKKSNVEDYLMKAKHMKVIWPEGIVTMSEPSYIQKEIMKESYNMPRYYKEALELVEQLRTRKVKSIIVWGAGEVGRVCTHFLKKEEIEVLALIDRKEWLWKSNIEEVPICSLADVAEKYKGIEKNILIASFSFIDEIKDDINENLENSTVYTLL